MVYPQIELIKKSPFLDNTEETVNFSLNRSQFQVQLCYASITFYTEVFENQKEFMCGFHFVLYYRILFDS